MNAPGLAQSALAAVTSPPGMGLVAFASCAALLSLEPRGRRGVVPLVALAVLAWLPLAILLATLLAKAISPEVDIGELDAQLLTGELPIDAFLDKDFDEWFKSASGSF